MKSYARILGLMVLTSTLISWALAGPSNANHGPTQDVPIALTVGAAIGDDCTDPIVIPSLPFSDLGQTNCGRGNHYDLTCLGFWDGGEDIVYQFTLTTMTYVKITMDPLGTRYVGILVDDACPPDLSCETVHLGEGSGVKVLDLALDAGTHYIMIDSWPPPGCTPAFDLTVEEFVPPCANAIDLQTQGLLSFDVDTCGGGSDLNPTNSCTGFEVGAPSEDLEYKIYLTAGESFSVVLTGEDVYTYDASIYLLTDCLDMESCVAGGDDHERFSYIAESEGWHYLIIDGVSGCGTATVTIGAPVSSKAVTWGALKSMFR